MNLGMLVGLGFGYIMFDKNGKKYFKKGIDKISETTSNFIKTLDKEGVENEIPKRSDTE